MSAQNQEVQNVVYSREAYLAGGSSTQHQAQIRQTISGESSDKPKSVHEQCLVASIN